MRDRPRRRGFPPIVAAMVGGGIITVVALSKATEVLGAASIPIWAMVIGAAVFVLRGPLGEALLHTVAQADSEREPLGTDPNVLAELDDLRAQVGELHERLDFTERLVAQQRETRPLASGERT